MAIFYLLYISAGLVLIRKLLLASGKPTKTIAWLLVIIFIPFIGMLLYLMLGVNRRKEKFFKLKSHHNLQQYQQRVNAFYGTIDQELYKGFEVIRPHLKLAKIMLRSSQFLPYQGNLVEILRDGQATFDSIFNALESAQRFIHLQYYIYEDGVLADRLADIFDRKIKEGVEIRIIYDGIGSRKLSRKHIRHLRHIGVQIYGFLPIRLKQFVTSFNYRNHRKIVIVDGVIGYTGGINVSDKYIHGDPDLGMWHDLHVKLEGPIVKSLQAVFAMDWCFVSQQDELLQNDYFPDVKPRGNATIQMVVGGPDSDFSAVRQAYFTLINQARDYIYITNSYVIPGTAILESLRNAALSGRDVRLLVPINSDSTVVKWSIRSYFEEMLQAGVRIFLYKDGFLHSKTIVVDDTVSSIGTANLDIRSFEQNFEVNGIFYDRNVALKLKEYFLEDCTQSEELNYSEFLHRPTREKMIEGVARMFSPIL